MDFFEKDFAIVELFDRKFALDFWNDLDEEDIDRILQHSCDEFWKHLSFPETESFIEVVGAVDKVSNNLH